jgi:hypothetical protein
MMIAEKGASMIKEDRRAGSSRAAVDPEVDESPVKAIEEAGAV